MKIIFCLLSFLVTAVLLSCSNSNQPEELNSQLDSIKVKADTAVPVEVTAQAFQFAFVITGKKAGDFIHAEKGVWVISSQGAMPEMKNQKHIDEKYSPDLSGLSFTDLPRVDCSLAGGWTKTGRFAGEENNFIADKIWTYAGLSKEQEKQVVDLAGTIRWTVIDTSTGRYYFSEIGGKWYLVIMDIRSPCEA